MPKKVAKRGIANHIMDQPSAPEIQDEEVNVRVVQREEKRRFGIYVKSDTDESGGQTVGVVTKVQQGYVMVRIRYELESIKLATI
jgi:hypothetical protein